MYKSLTKGIRCDKFIRPSRVKIDFNNFLYVVKEKLEKYSNIKKGQTH